MNNENHILFLKGLEPEDRQRELARDVTSTLQELVACVEQLVPHRDDANNACVIDDVQLHQPALEDRHCRVPLRFFGSARQGIGSSKDLQRIQGRAHAIIDDSGNVTYRDVALGQEPAFVAHDLGGGD